MARRKRRTFVVPTWRDPIPTGGRKTSAGSLRAACERAITSVRVYNDSIPVEAIECVAGREGVRIDVTLAVPDRDDREWVRPMSVVRSVAVPWDPIVANGPSQLVHTIRRTLQSILAHEVDENFLVYETLAYDPHRPLPGGADAVRS